MVELSDKLVREFRELLDSSMRSEYEELDRLLNSGRRATGEKVIASLEEALRDIERTDSISHQKIMDAILWVRHSYGVTK